MKRLLLLLLFAVAPAFAEDPQIFLKAKAAPTDVYVGDRIKLEVTVTFNGVEPVRGEVAKTAGEFEILSSAITDPRPEKDGRRAFTLSFDLITFTTGSISIPALPIRFQKSDGSLVEAHTDEVPIHVKSLLEEQGDQGGLKPLKGLYNVRSYWWLWALAGLLLLGALWWLWTQRARRGDVVEARREPLLSPEDEAAKALADLEATPLTEETIRDYYFRLSAILRRYVERRYGIAALEMTTSELNAAFRPLQMPVSASLICREFLDNGDLVKFAKLLPTTDETLGDVGRVKTFIDLTTPKQVPEEMRTPPEEAPL